MIDLRQGDCLEIVRELPNKSVDLLLTDAPYLHVKGGCKSKTFSKGVRDAESKVVSDMSDFGEKEINEFLDIVKPKMKVFNAYIFCSKLQIPYYLNWALKNKCQFDVLIWDKMNYGFISRKFFAPNIEYIIRIYKKGLNQLDDNYYQKIKQYKRPKNKVHEAEKPIELLKEFVLLSSNEGDLILDMFMGSGTTGLAVLECGEDRRFIGIEKDEKYFNIAKERIEKCIKEKE